MRIKVLFISGIIGLAVISGIMESLSTYGAGAKRERGEKAGEKEGRSDEKAER
jgi:hypothetical protein